MKHEVLVVANYSGRFIPSTLEAVKILNGIGMEQETTFIELKTQLASSNVMACFSEVAETRDTRGYSSGIWNSHESKAKRSTSDVVLLWLGTRNS